MGDGVGTVCVRDDQHSQTTTIDMEWKRTKNVATKEHMTLAIGKG